MDTVHRNSTLINMAGFLDVSTVNGPGKRSVLWVQGCPMSCRGCFNKELKPFTPKTLISIESLSRRILNISDIEGITFSGGEPFCQAEALGTLGGILKESGLNIVTFTGFPLQFLREKDKESWNTLLEVTDLLVAGPFVPSLICNEPLISSSNQRLIHLTGGLEERVSECPDARNVTEFCISPDGLITATGYAGQLLNVGIATGFSLQEDM